MWGMLTTHRRYTLEDGQRNADCAKYHAHNPLCLYNHRQRMVPTFYPVVKLILLVCVLSSSASVRAARVQRDAEIIQPQNARLPVVLWHGMGDSCCASGSIGALKSLIEEKLGE